MAFEDKGKDGDGFPQANLEKGAVLQEVRIFSNNPLKPKACYSLLSRILWVMMHGEAINKKEATDVFFGVTKLFQSKDIPLRRLVYVVLKELAKISDDVLIAIAILSKDMASDLEPFRANSIRVIARVIDTTMLGQVERNIKQSIVDKESYVASCALVSGIHLVHRSPDIVKRWVNEVQEAVNSRSSMVQYHALALLHQIRQQDPLAISKLIQSLTKGSVRSPLAHCLLIRYACKILADQSAQNRDPVLFGYVESCLRFSSDVVVFEAAKQITCLPNASLRELEMAISMLQPFLTSPKPTLRYAAVRVICRVAQQAPRVIDSNCCFELRNLISDTNRNISTIAVITLLQVEKENGIGILLKEIAGFVGEITDEFRVSVVDGIRNLASKYPAQHPAIMATLSSMLRAAAGFDYKRRIVDTFLDLVREIPESKDYALAYLCEYIEDCEFTYLSTKILHLLGQEGPQSASYSIFIRYIYNRVILEKAALRASALTALSKYSVIQPQVVKILLQQCIHDTDDHVRDKAQFFLTIMEKLPNDFSLINPQLQVPLENLEIALTEYIAQPAKTEHFDISTVPLERIVQVPKAAPEKPTAAAKSSSGGLALDLSNVLSSQSDTGSNAKAGQATSGSHLTELFPDLGVHFKTSAPFPLTEADTEYQVTCFKHIFPQSMALVLQFNVMTTLNDQALRNISIELKPTDASRNDAKKAKIVRVIPPTNTLFAHGPTESTVATSYIVLAFHEDLRSTAFPILPLSFNCVMKFESLTVIDEAAQEVDDSSGYQDEYPLDTLSLNGSDNVRRVSISSWANVWEASNPVPTEQGQDWFEGMARFSWPSVASLQDAVKDLLNGLGMQPCDSTEEVPKGQSKHILQLVGVHFSGAKLIGRARMRSNAPAPGVAIELCIRSSSQQLSDAIVQSEI